MASIKRLKKNITYIIESVAMDALSAMDKKEAKNKAEIDKLVDELLLLEVEYFDRVNYPDGKDNSKLIKQHYSALKNDFSKDVDAICKKLSDLVK